MKKPWWLKECKLCGKTFNALYSGPYTKYCPECREKAKKEKRKETKKGRKERVEDGEKRKY